MLVTCSATEDFLAVPHCWDCQHSQDPTLSVTVTRAGDTFHLLNDTSEWANARGREQLCWGTLCPSARHCCVTVSRAAPENPHSHSLPQVLSMDYIPFPRCKGDQKCPVVFQGNINVVFGLWCSRARLPITGGSIVQTRIPCWLIGKNIYTAK